MQDVFYIEAVEQAMALLKPMRIEILKQLYEPRTCSDLGSFFGESAQKIYYHVKAMQEVGLVERVGEQRVRGTVEGHYQAKALAYWLSPQLVGQIGGEVPAANQTSLRFLLSLAEETWQDVGRLGQQVGQDIPSLGISAYIHLSEARRTDFLQEVAHLMEQLARKYGLPDSAPPEPAQSYRLILTCYPKEAPDHD
jgi:DNA-binding transcriptional ArsR family regulator